MPCSSHHPSFPPYYLALPCIINMPTNLPGALPNIPAFWPGNYSPSSYASRVDSKDAKISTYDYIIVGAFTRYGNA